MVPEKFRVLENFVPILKEFSMSLEILFSHVSLRLGFSDFWLRGLGVLDFVFWTTVSIKTMRKLFI